MNWKEYPRSKLKAIIRKIQRGTCGGCQGLETRGSEELLFNEHKMSVKMIKF